MPGKEKQAPVAQTQAGTATPGEQKGRQLPVWLGPVIIVIILALFWLPQFLSNAAATVNGEGISRAELDRRVAFERVWAQWLGNVVPTTGAEATRFRSFVLDTMVENRLVLQQARKVGLTVSPQEITDKIASMKSDLKLTDAQINEDLTRAGLTRQTLENVMHEDVLVDKFLRTVVLSGVSQAEQQTVVRNWYNNALSKANIEKRIESGGAKVGQPAPDFTLSDLEGKPVRLGDLKGKPVLINFWATWCNPCRAEMPDLQALWTAYKERGLVVLGVNLTDQDDVNAVQSYVKELGLTFPVLLDERGNASSLYRVGPIPSSYFVNKEGILSAVQVGSMSRQMMENRVTKLLQ